ncbi:MAG: hypothetical protein V2A76_09975, partial [Planctomycetota bacterium]
LFDGEPERLSTNAGKFAEENPDVEEGAERGRDKNRAEAAGNEKHSPEHAPVEAAAAPSEPHELEVARERLDMGDVEWARRTAAAFLLRMDGLGYEDTRRSSEAYALLADVLRYDYERSLRGGAEELGADEPARARAEGEQKPGVEGGH